MLYCRLSFNSVRTTEYKTGILVPVECWPDLPPAHPETPAISVRIAEFRAQHNWIALNLKEPTAEAIRTDWIRQHSALPPAVPKSLSIIEAYGRWATYKLRPPNRKPAGWRPMSDTGQKRIQMSGRHLAGFLKLTKQVHLSLTEVKPSTGYAFSEYLFDLGVSADTVTRHITNLSESLDYAVRLDEIEVNPWAGIKIKGEPPKRIDYLNELDLIRLAALPLTGIRDTVRNWALLMCYTGLDYNDALLVTSNLGKYYKTTPDGDVIIFQRLKFDHAPQWGECHIPVLSMSRELLSDVLNWKRPRLKVINTHLKEIAVQIGLSFPMKAKHCRKSAALVFLLYYENIFMVQKILGHQSVKTTQACYVNTPPEIVYSGMRKKPVQK